MRYKSKLQQIIATTCCLNRKSPPRASISVEGYDQQFKKKKTSILNLSAFWAVSCKELKGKHIFVGRGRSFPRELQVQRSTPDHTGSLFHAGDVKFSE